MRRREMDGGPPEWLVHDGLIRCPYLPDEIARLPLRLPSRPLVRAELAERLRQGDRRQGPFLYRPQCPTCRACQAIRIDVGTFQPSRSQRRVFRRGEVEITTEVARPAVSDEKVHLYNRHKIERGLL